MTQIPGIYVSISGDFTQLKKELSQARQYIAEQSRGMSDALNNALSPRQLSNSLNGLVKNLGELSRASKLTGNEFKNIGVDLGALRRNTGLTESEFSKLQSQLLRTQAAKTQENALRRLASSAGLTDKEIAKMGRQFGLSSSQIAKVTSSANRASDSMFRLGNVVRLAMTYFSARLLIDGARNILRIADDYALLNSKLQLVTSGVKEFSSVYAELFQISQNTGTSFQDNASNFSNLRLALKDTNFTITETLSLFDSVSKSLTVAGATTAEASSFMLQFRQAMGSGKLAGDEFRGMMESNSYWGGLLAKALKTDVAGLREMAKEGKLTTSVIMQAFPQMSAQIDKDFSRISKTIQRANVELRNAFSDLVSDANNSVHGTNKIAEAISNLARTIERNKEGIISLFTDIVNGASWAADKVGRLGKFFDNLDKKGTVRALKSELQDLRAELDSAENGTFGFGSYGKKSVEEVQRLKDRIEQQLELIKEVSDGSLYKTPPPVKVQVEAMVSTSKAQTSSAPMSPKTTTKGLIDQYDKLDGSLKKYFDDLDKVSEKEMQRLADFNESVEATNRHIFALNGIENAKNTPDQGWEQAIQLRESALKESNERMKKEEKSFYDEAREAVTGWASGFASSLNDMLWKADATFGDILESFGKMLTQMVIQKSIVEPAVNGMLSFMASAQGNVFAGPGISAYSNQVVSQPTVFPFATGIGLMGEAGSEAILPLKRGKNGNLGVEGSGSVTNVIIHNNGGGTVTQKEKPNDTGGVDLEIVFDNMMAKNVGRTGSATNRALMATTGSSQPLMRR